MNRKTCLTAVFCVVLVLGHAFPAFGNESDDPVVERDAFASGEAVTMEGTSAVMVTLEPGAIRQEVSIPSAGSGADASDAARQEAVRNLRRVQELLKTGDEPTFALAIMLTIASGMLARALRLGGERGGSSECFGEGASPARSGDISFSWSEGSCWRGRCSQDEVYR